MGEPFYRVGVKILGGQSTSVYFLIVGGKILGRVCFGGSFYCSVSQNIGGVGVRGEPFRLSVPHASLRKDPPLVYWDSDEFLYS